MFRAVLQIALSFLGKRSGPMPSQGRLRAKEMFKHSGLPSIEAWLPLNRDESYVASMLRLPVSVTAFT